MTSWFRHQALALFVLLVSLAATGWMWQHEREESERAARARADFNLREISSRIEQQMAAYQQMLRGVQGLYSASENVERVEFRGYVDTLQLGADFSGIDGVGVLPLVTDAQRDAHEARMRGQGLGSYAISPPARRAQYAPLTQLEPAAGRNSRLIGLDLLADPQLRPTMEQARDSGAPAITPKLKLKLEDGPSNGHGFLMFLPLYAKGQPHDTLAQRRAAIAGWVVAPFRIADLMASLYGERAQQTGFRVYDGTRLDAQALMYDGTRAAAADPSQPDSIEYLRVGGRTWTLQVPFAPATDAANPNRQQFILVAGGGLSLLLTLLTWHLATSRLRASTLAREMTRELRASEHRFKQLAQHDALTGLPNRSLFGDRLHQALAQARRDRGKLAMMYIDLDKFKPVNDTLGHGVGDLLLKEVAKRMLGCVRESDTVGRIGGDEFVVLLPHVDGQADALLVAEKIRQALNQPFHLEGGHTASISSSSGVAIYPDHGVDEISLSAASDQAMYLAKETGRNQVRLASAPVARAAGTTA